MTLFAFDRLKKKPSQKLQSLIRPYANVRMDDGIQWDIGDEGEAFIRSYEIIRAHDNGLLNPNVHVLDDIKVYPQDREQFTGFVIVQKDFVCSCNPAEDFKRPLIGQCQTLLKDEVELAVDVRPKGLMVSVGNELIIHDDLLARIASAGVGGIKPVRFQGKELPFWNRVRIKQRHGIVDEMVFSEMSCGACGQPRIAVMNLWFGKTDRLLENSLCNTRGMSDYGEEPIIVISKDIMARLRKEKMTGSKSGLRFLPLYNKKTKRYEVIRKIQEAITK